MNILTTDQYNQGVGKSKLLSSTSGVGAVITTKEGYYILISGVNRWKFIHVVQQEISNVRSEFVEADWYTISKKRIKSLGLVVLDDPRFIEFLRSEKELVNLLCLLEIPHLALNDRLNTVSTSNNPVIQELKSQGKPAHAENFMVFGTHFPKWFKNRKGELYEYSYWKSIWKDKQLKGKWFAPPRDATDPQLDSKKIPISIPIKDQEGITEKIPAYHQLTQTNLGLICSNGHLSDIPWSRFLSWKWDRSSPADRGDGLLTHDHCCPTAKLRWTESTTKSEGYSSIYIECENCNKKVNLEGINNLSPVCLGEKPWEMDLLEQRPLVPREDSCVDIDGNRKRMQVSLVTGNSMYYSNGFSSLYIPMHLVDGVDARITSALEIYEKKYIRYLEFAPDDTKEDFFGNMMVTKKLVSDGFSDFIDEIPLFEQKLKDLFLNEHKEEAIDSHEQYRWQEFQCFQNNSSSPENSKDISFKDIELPIELRKFFNKIQQVEELKVCQVQLDFTRVKPNERILSNGEIVNTSEGQNIFSVDKNELLVLPANETYGEGIFFSFDSSSIDSWYNLFSGILTPRLKKLIGTFNERSQGASTKQRISSDGLGGAKFLLIHTFSHILMKELEFSCGYPTASLKERLFISDRMAGVLIYTSEGSEGSMGGLVWQGQPEKIEELIRNSLQRANDCSSDPLCWESDGQGLFDLNLAACFSCSMTSETACEEWNLGLDRRILVDSEFGFFRDVIY